MSEPSGADGEARQRRLDALRGLAQQTGEQEGPSNSAADGSAAPTAPQPASASARAGVGGLSAMAAQGAASPRWRAAALVALVALVALSVTLGAVLRAGGSSGPLRLGAGSASTPALAEKLLATTTLKHLYCLSDPAWAPNGAALAVFGQTNIPTDVCQPYNTQTALAQLEEGASSAAPYQSVNQATGLALDIIDMTTGNVKQQIALPPLFQVFGPPQSSETAAAADLLCNHAPDCVLDGSGRGQGAPQFQPLLQSLSWAPDGTSVVISFGFQLLTDYNGPIGDANSTPASTELGAGLIIAPVGAQAAAPRVLLHTAAKQPYNANVAPNQSAVIWDLSTGTATDVAPPATTSLNTTAFAPAYRWAPEGQLVPLTSAPTPGQAGQVAPTPWRSGVIEARQHTSDPVLYQTSQWLWSPDGRYTAPSLNTAAYVHVSGAGEATATLGSAAPPLVNPPWLALSDAIIAATNSPVGLEVAQSPNGALLASYSCNPDSSGELTIRSISRAVALAQTNFTYPYGFLSQGCSSDIGALVWSPDGKRLASSLEPLAQVMVWQVNVQG